MSDPVTTLVPFASLPSCAANCGALYDANGACVPPAAPSASPSVYNTCFCQYSTLQPLSQGTDVCNGACGAQDLQSISNWFTGFCADGATAPSSSAAAPSSSGGSGSSGSGSGGGDWISTHWQWVVMIVVIVVAIAGIWTGAAIWRRKYLRKKDRMYELGKGLPSSVAVNTQGDLVNAAGVRGSSTISQPGMFMSGSNRVSKA